jgi:hypothetical protein
MFHYNNVVAAYQVFVCVVSRAGRQVSPLASLPATIKITIESRSISFYLQEIIYIYIHRYTGTSANLQRIIKPYGTTRTVEHKIGTVITSTIMKIIKLKVKNLKQL